MKTQIQSVLDQMQVQKEITPCNFSITFGGRRMSIESLRRHLHELAAMGALKKVKIKKGRVKYVFVKDIGLGKREADYIPPKTKTEKSGQTSLIF